MSRIISKIKDFFTRVKNRFVVFVNGVKAAISNVFGFVVEQWRSAVKYAVTIAVSVGVAAGILTPAEPEPVVVMPDGITQGATWFDDISTLGDITMYYGVTGARVLTMTNNNDGIVVGGRGTNYAIRTGEGLVRFEDRTIIGDTPSSFTNMAVNVGFTCDTLPSLPNHDCWGVKSLVLVNPISPTIKAIAGEFATYQIGAGQDTQSLVGNLNAAGLLAAAHSDYIAGTISSSYIGAGTADLVLGVDTSVPGANAGTVITESIGIRIGQSIFPGGTIITATGLHIDSVTAGATDYAIYTNDGAVYLGDNTTIAGLLNYESTSTTIAGGVITVSSSNVEVDTQAGGATDDLDTINGGSDGDTLIVRAADDTHTVVLKDGTGNLRLPADCTMDDLDDTAMLIYDGTNWLQLACNNNS